MSPAEARLARVLAAVDGWEPTGTEDREAHSLLGRVFDLFDDYTDDEGNPNEKGRDLLDRARRAGVL